MEKVELKVVYFYCCEKSFYTSTIILTSVKIANIDLNLFVQ